MATLVYNPGEPDERSFTIGEGAVTIGRAEGLAVSIPHRSLSRSHARVEPAGGRFFVVDLGSKNGTHVNGVRVQRREMRHGDTLSLGDLDLLFRIEPAAADPRDPAGPRPQATRALLRGPLGKLSLAPGPGDEATRSQRRLRTLIEVAKLLPLSDDIDLLLGEILDLLFQILDVDRAVVLLRDDQTGDLSVRAVKTAQPVPDGGAIYSQNIVDYVLRKSVAALFTDAVADPRLETARSVVLQSVRASMCVPLRPRDDVIGVLYVDNLSSASLYAEDDLEFLVAFAGHAAVAVENAALYRRLERETVARMHAVMEAKLASLGTMVARIAHELRNPLNFMTNFAELSAGFAAEVDEGLRAQADRLPAEALANLSEVLGYMRENNTRISDHGRRATAIIQGMLQHARGPSGRREVADLNAVLAQSLRLGREGRLGRAVDASVVAEYDPAVGAIEMAPLEMGRVFLNVVENALHAMHEKTRETRSPGYAPELRVRTAALADHVEARIRDNGTGIPAEMVGRIFEPFFTTKRGNQGTGFGLSLSHQIVVEGHRGTMRVETALGEFTEIVITLPRGAGAAAPR